MTTPKLLTARQMAKKLGKSHYTILLWRRQGLIPGQAPTRRSIMFVEADVRAAIANFSTVRQ